MKAALVVLGILVASCGSAPSERGTSGGGGGSGTGGSGPNMCYVDFPCYATGKQYHCSDDGRHYQLYHEVSCESVCGSPCSGGGCRLDEKALACPEGRACQPSEDVGIYGDPDPCSRTVDAGVAAPDAAPETVCTEDRMLGLPAAARTCTKESDCAIVLGIRCCGPNPVFGEAKAQAVAYETCLRLPPGACDGLNCPSGEGYITDTGRVAQVIDAKMSVSCLRGLCTTDVAVAMDAGTEQ
jgi:hypothetical protein